MERRVAEFSQHVTGKLKTLINKCSCFLIALDESNDVTDISQLMIFARLVERFPILKNTAMKLFLIFQSKYCIYFNVCFQQRILSKQNIETNFKTKLWFCKIAFAWPKLTFPSI